MGAPLSYPSPPPPGDYGGQQPYGGYGGAQPQSTSVMAIISLVTGIIGIFPCCTIGIFSIAAIILGYLGKKEINESNGAKKGGGLATAGLITGIVGLVLGIAYWILVLATDSIDFYYN
jgi:hypothetical protein